MEIRHLGLALVCLLVLSFWLKADVAGTALPTEKKGITMALELKSIAFEHNGTIPSKHTCEGEDISPQLSWNGLPEGTRSLALIMDDPDAPPGTWVHWVIYDLPPKAVGLDEGVPRTENLDNGAKQGLCWGVDDFSRVGYNGPCPPPGGPHRYFFKLFALDQSSGLLPKATKADLLEAMKGHILARAELIGLYQR